MAFANLQFKIGSTFSGEGFKQAQEAVGNVKKSVQPALTATNSLSQVFDALSTSSNKAASAVGSLLSSFAQGGIQAAVITGALSAWNVAVNKFYENATKAAEAAKELSDALWNNAHGAFTDEMASRMSLIKNEVDGLRKNFDTITSQANAFRDAMNGLQSSRAEGGVIALQIEKFNAMLESDSEAMKKDIEATYNLKIAKEQAKNVEEQSAAKVQAATDARTQSEDRIRVIDDQLQTLETRRAQLAEELNTLKESDLVSRRDIKKKMDELAAKESQLDADLQAEIEKKKTLVIKEQTAIQDAANANAKMKLAVEEAAQKIEDTGTKWQAADPASFIGNFQIEQDAAFQEKVKELVKEMPKKLTDLKQANAEVKGAVERFNKAQNAYNDNFVQNQVWNAIQQGVQNVGQNVGGLNQNILQQQGQIAQNAGKLAGDAALAAGNVRTVAELKKVENEAAAAARKDIASKITTQQTLEATRAARLEKMSDKALSAADKKWLAEYKRVKEANDKQAKALEEAKKKVEDAKKRQEKMQTDIATIAEKLKDGIDIDGVEQALSDVNKTIEKLALK